MLRGIVFHDFDEDHHHPNSAATEGAGGEDDGDDDARALAWALDNVELVTVGVDIGSSTSHLLFARLHLQRLTESLSSRFVVVERTVLHRSPILLTPYRADGLIDVDRLEHFVTRSYQEAGLTPDQVDSGAVILTGVALERANARAVADLFAAHGGKFVCASAGHNLEAILAAHGSGAVALSRQPERHGQLLLHVDIGGGTSKLSLIRDGEVLETCAIGVGGRLVAVDAHDRVERIEPVAHTLAAHLGIPLALGQPLPPADRYRLAESLAEVLLEAITGALHSPLAREIVLTRPLTFAEGRPVAITFSGGVSEYVYRRETTRYGDLALDLADALDRARQAGRFPAPVADLGEGIRATVIGASQFTVQLSGNTVHISNPAALPVRNLPVVYARLGTRKDGALDERHVRDAIAEAFRRLDLEEGRQPVALAIPWKGVPRYPVLRALANAIAAALSQSIQVGFPLILALDGDIGGSLGNILSRELRLPVDVLAIDGLQLQELDYVDIGEVVEPAHVVPVVIKSLAFPAAPPG